MDPQGSAGKQRIINEMHSGKGSHKSRSSHGSHRGSDKEDSHRDDGSHGSNKRASPLAESRKRLIKSSHQERALAVEAAPKEQEARQDQTTSTRLLHEELKTETSQ